MVTTHEVPILTNSKAITSAEIIVTASSTRAIKKLREDCEKSEYQQRFEEIQKSCKKKWKEFVRKIKNRERRQNLSSSRFEEPEGGASDQNAAARK